MPDYDKIHDGPGPYQKPCKELLDGMPTELVSDSLLQPIIKTLKYNGNDAIATLLQVADYLKQIPAGPLFSNTIDWAVKSTAIDRMIRQSACKNKRVLSIITRVAKRQLHELQSGVYVLKDMTRMLLNNYIAEIQKGSFEEPVKRLLLQSEYAYPDSHLESLTHLWPQMLPKVDNIVDQIISSQSVTSIRKPPRRRSTRVQPTNISCLPTVYTDDLDALTL
ncbi:MAG TPA: hypothetical protein VGE45_11980 [Chloroflexia bacterium]|jgi:hypothetical protein